MSERYPIGKCASCGVNLVTAPEAKHESPQVCKSCRITELERDLATEKEKREAAEATLARVMNEKDHRISDLKGKLALAQDDLSLRTQELTAAETRLTEAVAEKVKLEQIVTSHREAVARFLGPHRRRLDESWMRFFVQQGIVDFDGCGFVKALPLGESVLPDSAYTHHSHHGLLRTTERPPIPPTQTQKEGEEG